MNCVVLNVATTTYYRRGQQRLMNALGTFGDGCSAHTWPAIPAGWPDHSDRPYAMKAFALKEMAEFYDILLWADASIVPVRSMEPLWERIERDGYWMSNNGFSNYEWTADSAYPDLFPECAGDPVELSARRFLNRDIPHVVATAFGLNVKHPLGKAFLDEYFRLASETQAFCGPWKNSNYPGAPEADGVRCAPCGPSDVRGHRHDQTAASVIAWRLGFELTNAPNIFAYRGGETEDTILVADGGY